VLVDPVAAGLLNGFMVSTDPEALAAANALVHGVAADGRALTLVRIPAAQAGQSLTVTVINDRGNESDSADADGGLAPVGGAGRPRNKIEVAAVDTAQGAMAFALYKAPLNFSRGSVDDGEGVRVVTLEVTANDNSGFTSSVDLDVLRPPVVFIHGLWDGEGTWGGFSPLIVDPRFFTYRIDYSGYVLGGVASTPPYPASWLLALLHRNSLGFAYNAPAALLQLQNFVADFSHNLNVAAAQADVVAHSMGGDISRTMALLPNFLSAADYGYGPIHKLITIGTPHLGTPLATQLLANDNFCVRNLMAILGKMALESVFIVGTGTVEGAVGYLGGDGIHGEARSPAVSRLLSDRPCATA
jgi:hypothetical protein